VGGASVGQLESQRPSQHRRAPDPLNDGPATSGGAKSTVSPNHLALAIAGFFGLASLARDAVLYRIFSFHVYPDTDSYLTGFWQRSRPYPVMGWITDAIDHPDRLIWLQLIIGAIATASLVWVIARRSPWLAFAVGSLFALDMNWAMTNRELLSEGALMSFSVLSLAVLGYQYERRATLNPVALVLAGILFAWTCTIRPSNLYLLLPIGGAYLLFTRSIRRTAWLSVGMAALLLASSWLTLIQTGKFRVSGGTGYFVAFPLFSYHLFNGSNGPASARIDNALRGCDPNVDYSKVVILTSNQHLWGEYFPCLQTSGWSDDQTDGTLTNAYVEAIRAHPRTWFENWSGWFAVELGFPLTLPSEASAGSCDATVLHFCTQWNQDLTNRPGVLNSALRWESRIERLTDPLRLVYASPLAVLPNPFGDPYAVMDGHRLSLAYVLLIGLVWIGVFAVIWFRTHDSIRVLALASAIAVVYVCATVPAGHVFLPRYVSVLSPLQTVLSVVVIFVVARFLIDSARAVRAHRIVNWRPTGT
jgi:hypothetical protein